MTTLALLLALALPAQADSEIRFRTAGPVVVLVDGERATLSGTLDLRARDLDPGPHHVEVQSVLRKTLYEGELEVADWTVTHASFANGRLEVLRTEDKKNAPADASVDAEEPTPVEVVEAEPEAPVEAVVVEEPEPAPEPIPAPEAAPEPLAMPEPVVAPVPLDPTTAPAIDTVEVALRDGMTLSVVHQEATVYLTVIDGELVMTDAHGLELRLGR